MNATEMKGLLADTTLSQLDIIRKMLVVADKTNVTVRVEYYETYTDYIVSFRKGTEYVFHITNWFGEVRVLFAYMYSEKTGRKNDAPRFEKKAREIIEDRFETLVHNSYVEVEEIIKKNEIGILHYNRTRWEQAVRFFLMYDVTVTFDRTFGDYDYKIGSKQLATIRTEFKDYKVILILVYRKITFLKK